MLNPRRSEIARGVTCRRSRELLATTKVEDRPMAAAAIRGLSKPQAARGMAARL